MHLPKPSTFLINCVRISIVNWYNMYTSEAYVWNNQPKTKIDTYTN